MKNSDEFLMFKYPSMIKASAFTSACFAFLAVLLKNSIVFIPEVSEVRACNIIPCTMGIIFGPAAALGCAVGNLIGDLGGSLTVLSYAGFFANFFSAWVPYKIWNITGTMLGEKNNRTPSFKSKHWILRYFLCAFCSVASCSAILGFRFDTNGDMSAVNTYAMIFLNNFGATTIGILLLILVMIIPEKYIPYWRKMMVNEKDLVFNKKDKKKVILHFVMSAAITIYFIIYMIVNGITLTNLDSLGNVYNILICLIYTLVQAAITFSCRWGEDDSIGEGVISLD